MSIFGKTRTFIVEEKDVTKILDLINEQRKTADFTVGNCGWEDSTKWFVDFDSTDKVYNRIVMRAYIKRRKDNLIVELDSEGNELVDCPEGTPFIARVADFMLTPSMYGGYTTATGKTFRFNMGAERNQYITNDTEEIAILRAYAKSTHKISDPTYKDSSSE